VLSVLGRGLCCELISRPEEPTDCDASLCVIYKPRECGGPGRLGIVAPETKFMFRKHRAGGRGMDGSFPNCIGYTHSKLLSYITLYRSLLQSSSSKGNSRHASR
jgi:hypothetical protein